MTDRDETFDAVARLIAPFNKKGVALTDATTFAGDLEWDSLVVMDFVADGMFRGAIDASGRLTTHIW